MASEAEVENFGIVDTHNLIFSAWFMQYKNGKKIPNTMFEMLRDAWNEGARIQNELDSFFAKEYCIDRRGHFVTDAAAERFSELLEQAILTNEEKKDK